jgi:excisionase family DNA binding protein
MFVHPKPRYSVNDLMALLNIGRNSLYDAINSGRLDSYKVGKRRFANPAAVDAYVALVEREGRS